MSDAMSKVRRALASIKGDRGLVWEPLQGSGGGPIAAFRGDITVGGRTEPCDTAMALNTADGLPGEGRVEFTTLIHDGRQGAAINKVKETVNAWNGDLPGKLWQDHTDGSFDIMYQTSEPVSKIDRQLIADNVVHHAQVKAKIKPELERLDIQLGLQPRHSVSSDEQFARSVVTSFKGLGQTPDTKYIARRDREEVIR